VPDFPIWPQCNIGCVFCSNPVEGFRETTDQYAFEKLKAKILEYKRGRRTFVKFDQVRDYFNLTGGEPTIHPDFHRLLAFMRREFPQILIRLLSNGRMFAYEEFARKTLEAGKTPFEIAVPLFGYDAHSHENTSRTPKSFEQTVAGLEHLRKHRKPGQLVEIRVIMTRIQERHLDGLIDFLARDLNWVDRVVFLYQEVEGFAEHYKDALKFPMSEAAAAIDRSFERLKALKEFRLYHFALCTVPLRLWPHVWNTLADFKVTYLEGCRTKCLYKDRCVGVHRSYQRHHGAGDIQPIVSERPVELSDNLYHPIARVHEPVRP
jgi:MoaA/NifB/PqqE/SkfB family radical SAM enzyme